MSAATFANLPRVVIVGRPNVGKSALFNRVLRRRAAIVHAEPGVTRDRLTGMVIDRGRRWALVDTGGLESVDKLRSVTATAAAIRRQVERALEDASLALLVVDARSGLTGADEAISAELRGRGMPALLAVNKCDHAGDETAAAEFSRLGRDWLPVSAAHGRGIDELLERIGVRLEELGCNLLAASAAPETPCRRAAIVGRPNVGKSSLFNAFLNEERALVADAPGTTRDAVEAFLPADGASVRSSMVITDTAGLRRARELDSAVEGFSIGQAERAVRACDIAALVLEAGRGPTAQDKKIAALIREHRRAALILANKTDLIDAAAMGAYRAEIGARLPFLRFAEVVFVSAREGRNIKSARRALDALGRRIEPRLTTGRLNRAIERAVQRVQPPLVRGARLKIFYAAQTGVNPLKIALFVNEPARLKPAFRQYIENSLRREFPALAGLPLEFECKPRR